MIGYCFSLAPKLHYACLYGVYVSVWKWCFSSLIDLHRAKDTTMPDVNVCHH